jgi:aspartyl protease family protein
MKAFEPSHAAAAHRPRPKWRHLILWGGLVLLAAIAYSFRPETTGVKERRAAQSAPAPGYPEAAKAFRVPLSADGHFHIRALVNGVPIDFLADTGATHIVVCPADAEKLGLRPERLRFDRVYETANGRVRGSTISIDDLEIGPFHMNDIMASVHQSPLRHSLLGMNFFNRLERYEVKADVMTLYWHP